MSMQAVRHYFDNQADTYFNKLTSGLLNLITRRERAIVMELLQPTAGETVLDAGCGPGIYCSFLKEAGCEVVGIDISPSMVEAARKRGIEAHVAKKGDWYQVCRRCYLAGSG